MRAVFIWSSQFRLRKLLPNCAHHQYPIFCDSHIGLDAATAVFNHLKTGFFGVFEVFPLYPRCAI